MRERRRGCSVCLSGPVVLGFREAAFGRHYRWRLASRLSSGTPGYGSTRLARLKVPAGGEARFGVSAKGMGIELRWIVYGRDFNGAGSPGLR